MSTSMKTGANRKRVADARTVKAAQLATTEPAIDAAKGKEPRAPRGTAPALSYRVRATTSRGGCLHRSVDVVPGFTPATRQPANNPLRDLKRAWVRKYGARQGRALWLVRTRVFEYRLTKARLEGTPVPVETREQVEARRERLMPGYKQRLAEWLS